MSAPPARPGMPQAGAPPPPVGPADRVAEALRASARPAPVPPAVAAGLRTATATVAPLLAGHVLGIPDAMLAGLGGFMVSRADNGGAYRSRAAAMAAQALAVAFAAVAGALLRPWPAAAVPAVLLWTTAASLARAYGPAAGATGVTATVMFVVALSTPSAGTATALEHGGWVLVGAAWAMLLSLALWPVRPYRPGILAVAACYRALADYADALATPPEAPATRGGAAFLPARQAVEAARATLAAIRRGRSGESVRGERLLVLLETADRVLINLVALGDVLEGAAAPAERRAAEAALGALAAELRGCAERVEGEGEGAAQDAPGAESPAAGAGLAGPLLDRVRFYARAAARIAEGFRDGRPVPEAPVAALRLPEEASDPLLPLRENLTRESALLRHALRAGISTAAATAATQALGLERGYWVTLTVLIVLQPYTGATVQRTLERALGTVMGGGIAAGIAAWVHDPGWVLALVFVMAAASVALFPINAVLYTVFLTPTFVLLAEANTGDWGLAGVRVLDTLLGGALALAGAALLWPTPERDRLPAEVAAVLRADAEYLRAAVERLADGGEAAVGRMVAARRRLGVAILNADAWLEQLLAAPGGRADELEPWMTLLAYGRRLAGSVAALAILGGEGALGRGEVAGFGAAAEGVLAELADALEGGRPPAPLPPPPPPSADPLLRAQLDRVTAQVAVLHDAARRLFPA